MRIDDRLNLVIPIEAGDGVKAYVHSTPIGVETFERYYLVLGKLFSRLMTEGLNYTVGPRVAYMMLRDVALATPRPPNPGATWWEGTDGVEMGLLAEIERLTNVIGPNPNGEGWSTLPLRAAVDAVDPATNRPVKKWLTREEFTEAMGQVTFFMVASQAPPMGTRASFVMRAADTYGSRTTSLNSTEYANSLRTSTRDATSAQPDAPVIPQRPAARADPVATVKDARLSAPRPSSARRSPGPPARAGASS